VPDLETLAPFGGAAVLLIAIASTSGQARILFMVVAVVLAVGFTLSATIWKRRDEDDEDL
jgi:cell division protein FtsX